MEKNSVRKIKKNLLPNKKIISFSLIIKSFFWFFIGISLGLFLLISFILVLFQKHYDNIVYPGVMVNGTNFGGKTKEEVGNFFAQKNSNIAETIFSFVSEDRVATISAKELDYGYNKDLLATQVYSVGRSSNVLSNLSLVFQAYLNGVNLLPSYSYSEKKLEEFISPFAKKINIEPVDALFKFENGKVSTFKPSANGQEVDMVILKNELSSRLPQVMLGKKSQKFVLNIPIRVLKPKITTEKVNTFGIKEIIGSGTSLFKGSIQNRIYNITLASARLNGLLVAPDEIFSFDKALGDVSAFTGYQQAYIIQNGRTVLGDGGGVCQVSTTFFRALLNAGLPIVERNAHAYRVGYYEQDSPPGFDATIYTPSIDLKFKNDTGNYILIQGSIDPIELRLTFTLFGTKDERQVTISKPVVTSESSPPAPLYQDDSNLPKGVIKQVDFSAWGANVFFTREVIKNGKKIVSDKFTSSYKPWQAVYLRGTKE